ncbi:MULTISPECIES: ParB/RepB/Spo0J family partition protein [unclassified Mesorhizobium]|uniref:ParB/RepB/Spo0J family partition protein n=1 Tax=unclassified Mesorhizobium TaxID=325217 RepID=UPI0015E32391|nr:MULTISPECIES: ParB/RepB/Spo0J family partition protein [unclassified Mesorhizobium]
MASATFDIDDLDAGEALEALEKALVINPTSSQDPEVLSLKELQTIESIFQPRNLDYRDGEHEAHIDTLAKAIGKPEKPRHLEPITVWWGGAGWFILDGHHRRLAYKRAGVVGNIPVRVFRGSIEEAFSKSVSLNSKNKMPMSLQDKMNAAWRLTARTDYSKSHIALECAVADGSVANMRRVKRALLGKGMTSDRLLEMNWTEAQLVSKGEEKPEVDHGAEAARRARGYAQSIARALKDRPHKDPEGFALALLMLDERLPARLLETAAWADVLADFRKILETEECFDDY